jgi:hypothetical protein
MDAGAVRLWLILLIASIAIILLTISPQENHKKGHLSTEEKQNKKKVNFLLI